MFQCVYAQYFHYIGNKVQGGNNILNNSPNYFKFHHINNNEAPKVFPYNNKGLIRLNVPITDVEFAIFEDLQRQTKNFSPDMDFKPAADELESMEWEARFNNRKPITDEHVKRNTKFKETYEQVTVRPIKSPPTTAKSIILPPNQRPIVPKFSNLLNFDAYLKKDHQPLKTEESKHKLRASRRPAKMLGKDYLTPEESNLITKPMKWEELNENAPESEENSIPHGKNLYQ